MKKVIALLIATLLLISCVPAFAEGDATTIAVVYSSTIDDKGWCQAMHTGIQNAIAAGYNIDYTPIETVAIPDAQSTIERLAGEYDVIIVHGAQFANACTAVAEEYPEQVFVLGTTDKVLGDNIFSYMPQSEEPGYVNGVLAALLTKNGKVGIVGSSNSGDSYRYVRGFILGYRSVKPDAEDPMLSWTGSFDDTVGAGDIATTMVSAGCDVLTGTSQQAVGAIRIAASENVIWLGQTLTQKADFAEIVPAAADYEYGAVVMGVLEQIANGVTGGMCIPMNYNNGGFVFEFSENEELIPADVKAAGEAALEALKATAGTVDYDSVVLE